jgi:hypothetical protein
MADEKMGSLSGQEQSVAVSPSAATGAVAPKRLFTATLTEDQYAYVKSLGRLGLSRLIQKIMDTNGLLYVTPPAPKWWKVWK